MGEHRKALVVAIDTYAHPTFSALRAPTTDAAELADVLGDPHLGGFDVNVVSNASSWEVAAAVEQFLGECAPSDLLLLHFSCHGIKDERGGLFLAASNTLPNRLVSTAVDSSLVSRLIQRSRAQRVILLLDCCYGGAFERGVVARSAGEVDIAGQFSQGLRESGRGRVVITASSAMEYAFEGTELSDTTDPRPSLFTGALVQGIRSGEADRDQDGQVALSELYEYVHEKVRERTPDQTPSKWEFGVQGDLYVASNPHRRISPAPLAPELVELITHQHSGVRLTAVAELDQLAGGTQLRIAAGAREALRQLSDDDSRRVATAAAAALARTTLQVNPAQVDLGPQIPGQVARADVRLEGGPLALASAVNTSSEQVQAWIEGGTLRIRASVEQEARFDEEVRLSGPSGEATVRLLAEVRAPAAPPPPVRAAPPTPAAPVSAVSAPVATTPPVSASPPPPKHVPEQAGRASSAEPAASPAVVPAAAPGADLSLVRWSVVAMLALAAAALTWWSVSRTPPSGEYLNPLQDTEIRWLGLAAPVGVLGTVALRFPRWQVVGAAMLTGAGLWMWVLWCRIVAFRMPQDNVNPVDAIQGGSLMRLLGAIGLTCAGVLAISGIASLRVRIGAQHGPEAIVGGVLVLAGAALQQVTWLGHPPTPTQTIALALFFGWVPWVRLSKSQRLAALMATVTYVVCSAARDLVAMLAPVGDRTGQERVVVVIGLLCVLAGVAVGQRAWSLYAGSSEARTD